MNPQSKPRLVSFSLCPFVRRSVIMLLEKKVPFDITYIDLGNKPDWFLKMSPLGLVPLLDVGGSVLFESAMINEYLDEVHQPAMHPRDALKKAKHRAWIEFGSTLLGDTYVLATTKSKSTFDERRFALMQKLDRLERECSGPFFDGPSLCLVDMAMAPALHQFVLLQKHFGVDLLGRRPHLAKWSNALLERDSVRGSVPSTFEKDWVAAFTQPETVLNKEFKN
jgi:glutathione S-transferase